MKVDIRLAGVSKSYDGKIEVVKDVDLSVEHGQLVTLLGPSGCGKTTTLKMISGFESITKGDIFLENERINGVPAHRRDVTTVFQNYALFPHLTVFKNVAFGLVRRRTPRAEIKTRVANMLELVGLDGFEERFPSELSGGQQQRVALARSLVTRPKVILLDEPLSNLDAKLRKRMEVEIRSILHENNVTAIHVTHDQEEALTMSDQIAVMNAGRIEQFGPPDEIYRHPASRWVAQFIGTSNIFEATGATRERNGTVLAKVAGRYEVRATAPEGPVDADKAWIIVRPEAVRVVAENEVESGVNALPGRVRTRLYLGRASRLDVEVEGLDVPVVVDVVKGQDRFLDGDSLWVAWEPEEAWVLAK
jgi:spermidine/putrescine transport system ATP-binding protein